MLPVARAARLPRRAAGAEAERRGIQAAVEKGVARLLTMQTERRRARPTGRAAREPISGAARTAASASRWRRRRASRCRRRISKRLCDYLSEQLRGAADSNDTVATLAERASPATRSRSPAEPEPAYHEVLFKKRDVLTQESRALLALAIIESKGPAKMADTLLRMQDKPVEEDFWFGSSRARRACACSRGPKLSPKSTRTEAIADAALRLRATAGTG